MRTIRWIAIIPVAFLLSFAAWFALSQAFTRIDYVTVAIRSGLPTALFVVAGVAVSPRKNRKISFIVFGFAVFISGGGAEALTYYHIDWFAMWVTTVAGMVFGAVIGLVMSLRFQTRSG
jgi:hypothetical protein